jgi:hypothetical protein
VKLVRKVYKVFKESLARLVQLVLQVQVLQDQLVRQAHKEFQVLRQAQAQRVQLDQLVLVDDLQL